MRWQAAAREVVGKLQGDGILTPEVAAKIHLKVKEKRPAEAFAEVGSAVSASEERIVGWHKFWVGGTLYGWFGEIVTSEPLRLVALEISEDEVLGETTRADLLTRYNGSNSNGLPTDGMKLLKEMRLLTCREKLSSVEITLLQRLNLDRRDRPFVSCWRWSLEAGSATLSDDGRIQIKPALAWGRALEAAQDDNGRLPEVLSRAFASVDPASSFLPIAPDGENPDSRNPGYDTFLSRLSFFGLGQAWEGGVMLEIPLGEQPKMMAAVLSLRTI